MLVFKTSSRHILKTPLTSLQRVLKTPLTSLQRNNFTPSKTAWRRLEDVLEEVKFLRWRRLEDVLKTCLEGVLKACFEDVLKTCLEDVLTIFWRQKKYLLGISVYLSGDNKSKLYQTSLYFTNLYPIILRRIQNALIRTQKIHYSPYFGTQAASLS